jgi:biotin carboxylase
VTNLVMVMPYRAFVAKAQREGFRVFAIWDPKVAKVLFGAHATEYLQELRRKTEGFALTDFTDRAEFDRVLRTAIGRFAADLVYHVGTEDTMLATYRVAEELGKSVNPSRSIELLNDKLAMRRLLLEHGRSTVRFAAVDQWQEVAGVLDEFEPPVVVKPTTLAGSRGVYLLSHRDELARWGRLLDSYGYRGPVLVEEYLRGPEFSVETLSVNGQHRVIGVTRKVLGAPPLFVELGHVHPVPDSAQTREMAALTVDLLQLAGYRCGPAHTEVIWTPTGPEIVESQARLGGDRIPQLVELATGFDPERAMFQILAGRPLPDGERRQVARIAYFELPPGELRSVTGLEQARALDFVADLSFPFGPGDRIPETVDSKSRHGYVMVVGDSEEHTAQRVEQVRALVQVTVEAGTAVMARMG